MVCPSLSPEEKCPLDFLSAGPSLASQAEVPISLLNGSLALGKQRRKHLRYCNQLPPRLHLPGKLTRVAEEQVTVVMGVGVEGGEAPLILMEG